MPRKITPGPAEVEVEEEELDHEAYEEHLAAEPEAPRPRPTPHLPDRHRGPPIAFFAIGALLVLLGAGLLIGGFTQDYYEVDYREGPQPDLEEGEEDDSLRTVLRLGLDEFVLLRYPGGTGSPVRENMAYEQSPTVGIVMKQLSWSGYIGGGLLVLALLAALLHRFGALTVSGPAPVMAAFGVVLLATGVIPFMTEVAHHARIEYIGGRLDLHPMFWTSNADGDFVHDLYMQPLVGFWLHVAGVVAAAVGTVFLFWGQLVAAGRSLRTFAESSAARLD